MAVVTQANVVQLLLAAHKRGLADAPTLTSPGAVKSYREALIDWRTIKQYSDEELMLRAHQVWGQHCVFCWAFHGGDPHHPPAFSELQPEDQMRCGGQLDTKAQRVAFEMKRLRNEQHRRSEPTGSKRSSEKSTPLSSESSLTVFGKSLHACPDQDLLALTCQYAGMLAVLRWMQDAGVAWNAPDLMIPDARS